LQKAVTHFDRDKMSIRIITTHHSHRKRSSACVPLEGAGAGWFRVWEDGLGREEISSLGLDPWLGPADGEDLVTCGAGVENSTSTLISTRDL
jgi:hypothetical protein